MGIIDISTDTEPIVFVVMNKILKYFQLYSRLVGFMGW